MGGAEIGSQLIARSLTKEQGLALKTLAPYLRNIKHLVRTLGADSLEEYCRFGHLSAAKIKELEDLQDDVEEDGGDGNED